MRVEQKHLILCVVVGALLASCADQPPQPLSAAASAASRPGQTRVNTNTSALIGTDGDAGFNTSIVLNQYAEVTANANAGATSITVADINSLTSSLYGALAQNDVLLVIQMQGASIDTTDTATYGEVTDYNSAGLHEFVEVQSIAGNTITIKNACGGLKNSYSAAGKTQVVRVPQFTELDIGPSGTVLSTPWNGTVGGIVAVNVQGRMTLQGNIDVNGAGFRGGTADNVSGAEATDVAGYVGGTGAFGAEKGEGIASHNLGANRFGRGAPANGGGGGNSYRAGGGGGANGLSPTAGATWSGQGIMDTGVTTFGGSFAWPLDGNLAAAGVNTSAGGGRGGYSYSFSNQAATGTGPNNAAWQGNLRRQRGGLGGRPLTANAADRLFLGGGGGSGDGNTGSSGSGGRGGGLIYVMAGDINQTGALNANGTNGSSTTGSNLDGAGGGGAGGTVVVRANRVSQLTIAANGGVGGNQDTGSGDTAAGPGGGGGGGYIAISTGSIFRSASGEASGKTDSTGMSEFPVNGATYGAQGTSLGVVARVDTANVTDIKSCISPADLSVTINNGNAVSVPGETVTYTITVTNNGSSAVQGAHLVYRVPVDGNGNTVVSGLTWTCPTCVPAVVSPQSGTINTGASFNQFFDLASGATATYLVSGTIIPSATVNMLSSVGVFGAPSQGDPNLTNNWAQDADLLGPRSNLNLALTQPDGGAGSGSTANEDSPLAVTIFAGNAGPSQAATTVVTITLPPPEQFTYTGYTAPGWSCALNSPTPGVTNVRCTRNPFAVTPFTPITVNGTVLLAGGTINWTANTVSTTSDPDTFNNNLNFSTTVTAINDPPTITAPTTTQGTAEELPLTFSIANSNAITVDDVDIGSSEFLVTIVPSGAPAHGLISLGSVANLTFVPPGITNDGVDDTAMRFSGTRAAVISALNGMVFQPRLNFNGTATLSVSVSDQGATGAGGPQTVTSNITIQVGPVNDPPLATADDFTIDEYSSMAQPPETLPPTLNVLANDSAFPDNGETLTVIGFPQLPAHGRLQGGGTTALSYVPFDDYFGPDSFTYTLSDGLLTSVGTVTITVRPLNDPPKAANDTAEVPAGSVDYRINVLANDTFAPDVGETLSIADITQQPANGTVTITATGILYTPTAPMGSDQFKYRVSDGTLLSLEATVLITIGPGNDAPVNSVPGAQLIDEDTTLTFAQPNTLISVSDEDAAAAPVQVTIVAEHGVFSLGGTTAPLAFSIGDGTDDATMTFNAALIDVNVALAGSVFKPDPDFNGAAALRISTNDLGNTGFGGAKTDTDTVTITVSPVNDQPVPTSDAVTIAEDTQAERIAPLSNDTFAPDVGETLRVISVSTPLHGSASIVLPAGEFITYTPEANYFGSDSFTYTITDGNGGLATATITINVLNVNDPPQAVPDLFSISQDSLNNLLFVLANDTYEPDPFETLSVIVVSPASHGTAAISDDNQGVIYTPAAGYVGPDGFTYTVRDSNGGFAATSVTLTVGADTDRDGLSDDDERGYGTNPLDADSDDDLLPDGIEALIGKTNPLDDDTDDDGLLDGSEDSNRNGIKDTNETDPKNADTDSDTLTDGLERGLAVPQGKNTKLTVFRADADPTTQTNPLRPDTDSGGDFDAVEDANRNGRIDSGETDPNNPLDDRKDFDNDGLTDAREIQIGLDPNDGDTDDDGVVDGTDGTADTDGDGLIDAIDPDSDNDGLFDGTEIGISDETKPRDTDVSQGHYVADADPTTKTNPKAKDSDLDTLDDGVEDKNRDGRDDAAETDASKADTDGDGLSDGLEVKAANPTNPEVEDTDGDKLLDGEEDLNANGKVDVGETDPNIFDSDGGGAGDGEEVERGTDPLNRIDDFEARGGGGCETTAGGAWLWLSSLAALGLIRRRRGLVLLRALTGLRGGVARAVSGPFVAVLVVLVATGAQAQTVNQYNTAIDVQRFKPGVGSQDFMNIESAKVAPHLTPFAGVHIGYANQPLVLGVPGSKQNTLYLVNDLTFFDLSVGLALKEHLELAIALPLSIARGQSASQLDPSLGLDKNGFGAGDLRFVPKYSFFEIGQPFQLAVSMPLVFPTGASKSFRGGGAVMVSPKVLAELNLSIFRVVANAGFNLRTAQMQLMNITVGQEFTWAAGGEFPIAGDWSRADRNALILQAAVNGAVGLKKQTGVEAPIEVLAGLKFKVGNTLAFELGGGAGLTRGVGSPRYQIIFGFSYQHAPVVLPESWFKPKEQPVIDSASVDKTGPGETEFVTRDPPATKRVTAPAATPEVGVAIGERPPEPAAPKFADADRDGVADEFDKCPKEKETINGNFDDDGCPDKGEPKVSIKDNKLTFKGKLEFSGKSARLTPPSESLAKQLALVLKANPDAKLRVDVYTTDLNSLDDNNLMSAQRSATIREFLLREGVDRRRVLTRALGMTKPLDPSAVELMLL